MPVLYNNDDDYNSRHDTDDYSFVTRSDRSRDFARRRRFGEDEEEDHAMSQMSLPLRVSRLGSSSRRSFSPALEDYSSSRQNTALRPTSSYSERTSRLSGPVRQALAFCGELDEDDPYYKARHNIASPLYDDDDDSDEYVIVMKRKRKRHPMQGAVRDVEYMRDPVKSRRPVLYQDYNDDEMLFAHETKERPRKQESEEEFSHCYTMPISRRQRQNEILAEDDPLLRDASSYIATRKQFAVESDEDMQKLKNQKYQYRTRGPNCRYFGADEEQLHRKGEFDHAPLFILKPRSHVIWEKMYVKFTCTVRGSPEPKVTWYHNMVAIEPVRLQPGTMKISHQFGVHTLEIFQATLEDSGTYRVSAQNTKGEISSYATLVVRRYDGVKSGYYDKKSGYNLKRPTDFPDVEKLDVPEIPDFSVEPLRAEASSRFNDTSSDVRSGKSMELGEGKYESVLEFRIPGKQMPLDSQQFDLQTKVESAIEPVAINRWKNENEAKEEMNEKVEEIPTTELNDKRQFESKEVRRELLGQCLSQTMGSASSGVETSNDKNLVPEVMEDVQRKVISPPVQVDLLTSLSPTEENTKPTAAQS